MICMNNCRFWLVLRNSGKFLETAWRAIHSHQAAHEFYQCFGVPGKEPPGGTLPAARQRMGLYQILGVFMSCLAETNNLPGDAN